VIGEVAAWQGLLDGLGWVLARVYDFIPNYGVAIIILTLLIRLLLLPLGIKQIKSMQSMQAIQPKVKELQKKYKGNKAKAQEETMKLYREAGVNPLGGCLPLLLQFPILIAMYSVLRPAPFEPIREEGQVVAYEVAGKNHLPVDSAVFADVVHEDEGTFLGMNLQCSLLQAGTPAPIRDSRGEPVVGGVELRLDDGPIDGFTSNASLECGSQRFPAAVPYAVLLILMIGSTYYSQRQMQKASPAGAQNQQQQVLMKIMPVMIGVFGLQFGAGLVLYWMMSNLIQIGQQAALLKAGHIGPEAMQRRMAEAEERAKAGGSKRQGLMQRMQERAEAAQKERERDARSRGAASGRAGTPPKGGKRPRGEGPQPKKRGAR
jgi:YidC/Oxa1 family membrane protein insertase